MLARVAELRAGGRLRLKGRAGVFVKAAKRGQDVRLDLPAVGSADHRRRQARATRGPRHRGGRGADRRPAGLPQGRRRGGIVRLRMAGMRPLKIALVAGEPSGDALGAKLIQALREIAGTDVTFVGVGGPRMEAAGLESGVSAVGSRRHGHPAGAGAAAAHFRAYRLGGRACDRGQARRADPDRQPRFHPPRRAPRARQAAEHAGDRLRKPDGLGVAAGPRPQDEGLCRQGAGAAAVRARRARAARRPRMRLCRPSADRAAGGTAAQRRGGGAARLQAAGGAGAAGIAALGSGAADGRFRRRARRAVAFDGAVRHRAADAAASARRSDGAGGALARRAAAADQRGRQARRLPHRARGAGGFRHGDAGGRAGRRAADRRL